MGLDQNRKLLRTRIQESKRAPEIIAALRLVPEAHELVDFLQAPTVST